MAEANPNARLEAFCDGVFAIALTLLVIDIKIPPTEPINTASDLWAALGKLAPSVFAFVLSFVVILITWVNHHNSAKLVRGSSGSYIYATGFMLLTVVFLPFPTALLGEHLFTDHASPAVILYVSVLALQSLSWVLIIMTVLGNNLEINERATIAIRTNQRYGIIALILYSLLAVAANWFPVAIMVVTSVIWIFWLIHGINVKPEE